jgi:hypothetical protein
MGEAAAVAVVANKLAVLETLHLFLQHKEVMVETPAAL